MLLCVVCYRHDTAGEWRGVAGDGRLQEEGWGRHTERPGRQPERWPVLDLLTGDSVTLELDVCSNWGVVNIYLIHNIKSIDCLINLNWNVIFIRLLIYCQSCLCYEVYTYFLSEELIKAQGTG